jgi:hypothetical protein
MADKKISQLSAASTPLAGTEVLPIVQSSATVKVATNDLTVRNVRANATTGILQVTGPAAASTRVMTVPDANFTAARTDAAQSFTGDQTLSTGNIIQGTAAKGIDFSANTAAAGMTSELLNWYEEGTFTPTLIASGGGTTAVDIIGRYNRIGRVVYFNIYMNDGANNFGTGTISFGGLPFTCQNSRASTGVVSVLTRFVTQPNTSTSLLGWVTPNGTTVDLYWNGTDGNNFVALNATHVTSPTQSVFALTGFYFV